MRRRYANRRDANERDVIAALEAIGCDVLQLNEFDLLVGRAGLNLAIECKDGSKPPSARKLTPSQLKLRANWRGHFAVVTSVDEAIAEVTRHTTGRR